MNLYKLKQNRNNGYDTYDSCIVAACDEHDAREIHPSEFVTHVRNGEWKGIYAYSGKEYSKEPSYDWVDYRDLDAIKVEYIGVAKPGTKKGVVLASFNAG